MLLCSPYDLCLLFPLQCEQDNIDKRKTQAQKRVVFHEFSGSAMKANGKNNAIELPFDSAVITQRGELTVWHGKVLYCTAIRRFGALHCSIAASPPCVNKFRQNGGKN
jgi:hypothetical protein